MNEAAGLKLQLERIGTKFENLFVKKIKSENKNIFLSGFIYFDENYKIQSYEYALYFFRNQYQLKTEFPFKPSKENYIYFQIFNVSLNEIDDYYKELHVINGMLLFTSPDKMTILVSSLSNKKRIEEETKRIIERLPLASRPQKQEELETNFKDTINVIKQSLQWGQSVKKIEPQIIQFVPPAEFTCFGVFLQGISQMNEIGTFLAKLNQQTGDYDDYLWQYLLAYLLANQQNQIRIIGEIYNLLGHAFGLSKENCIDYFTRTLTLLMTHIRAPNNLVGQTDNQYYIDLSIPPYHMDKFPTSLNKFLNNKKEAYLPSSNYQIFKINGIEKENFEIIETGRNKYNFIYELKAEKPQHPQRTEKVVHFT